MPAFMPRRAVLALTVMFGLLPAAIQPALAAGNVAESYVGDNIHKGLEILNNKGLPKTQREQQFEVFLLNLTDMKRIAMFTLGQYRRGASQADLDAFAAAFQNYATAVYQSYFSKYSGQTLKVTGSTERSPTDFVVATQLVGSRFQPAAAGGGFPRAHRCRQAGGGGFLGVGHLAVAGGTRPVRRLPGPEWRQHPHPDHASERPGETVPYRLSLRTPAATANVAVCGRWPDCLLVLPQGT